MELVRIPRAESIDKAAERLARSAGVPVAAIEKKTLRRLAASAVECNTDPDHVNLP